MKIALVFLAIVSAASLLWGSVQLSAKKQAEHQSAQLKTDLSQSESTSTEKDETISDLKSKLDQMIDTLTNSTAKLARSQSEAANYKNQLVDLKMSEQQKEDYHKLLSQVPDNEVWSKAGKVLLVGGEFIQLDGRKVVFKSGDGDYVNFDVDDLHPAVLARYHIDATDARTKQAQMDANARAWQVKVAIERQHLLAEQKQQEAAQAVIDAENAKEAAIQERADEQQRFENSLKAESANADMERANAAMYEATHPMVISQ